MDGNVHDKANNVGTFVVGAIASQLFSPQAAITTTTAFFLGGLLFSPDLDLPQSRPSKRWGCFAFLWTPYRWLCPNHRLSLSHAPLLGSALRLAYATGLGAIVGGLIATAMGHRFSLPAIGDIYFNLGWSYLGLELSALLHLFLDQVSSMSKSKGKK